ncbi:hypothetical protein ACFMQL_18415 [Nonomuraea fastidiosa]
MLFVALVVVGSLLTAAGVVIATPEPVPAAGTVPCVEASPT